MNTLEKIILYVIDAYDGNEVVDNFYGIDLEEAKKSEAEFLQDGLRVSWTAYAFTKDEAEAILYEYIVEKQS